MASEADFLDNPRAVEVLTVEKCLESMPCCEQFLLFITPFGQMFIIFRLPFLYSSLNLPQMAILIFVELAQKMYCSQC